MIPSLRLPRPSVTFPLAALLALALLVISEFAYHRSMAATDTLQDTVDVRLQVQTLLRQALDAETGQRGYLLTGKQDYLKPFNEASDGLRSTLAHLQQHYAGSPDLNDFKALEDLVAQKLSELQLTVQLQKAGREESWRTLLDSDIGREQMTAVRAAADKLVMAETQRIADQQAQIRRTLLLSRLGIAAMTPLSLLAFFMFLRQSAFINAEREKQRAELQAERDSLDRQVQDRTTQLTELANHLQTAREDERARLARELHDELGSLLTAAKLDVARLRSRLTESNPEAAERIAHLIETLNSGIALKRRIIEDLRPSALSNLGLTASLEILARDFAQNSGLSVQHSLNPVHLSPSGELTVYRLVQEAFTNIAKYAKAQTVKVELVERGQDVEVKVEDDGDGFDATAWKPSTHGLLGMRYRVEAEGGRMTVWSQPQRGTTVSAALPQVAQANDADV